jgi:hypothetical protein
MPNISIDWKPLLKTSPDDWLNSALMQQGGITLPRSTIRKWVYSGGAGFDAFNDLITKIEKLGGKVVHIPWFGS